MGRISLRKGESDRLLYLLLFLMIMAIVIVIAQQIIPTIAPTSLAQTVIAVLFSSYGVLLSFDILAYFVRVYEGSKVNVVRIRGQDHWVNMVTGFAVVVLVIVLVVALSLFVQFEVVPLIISYLTQLDRFILFSFFICLIPISLFISLLLKGDLGIIPRIWKQLVCFHGATLLGAFLAGFFL